MTFNVCVGVLPAYVSVYNVYTWYLQRPEEGIGSPGAATGGGCQLPDMGV